MIDDDISDTIKFDRSAPPPGGGASTSQGGTAGGSSQKTSGGASGNPGAQQGPSHPAAPPLLIPTPFKHRDLATFPRRQFLYGRHLIRGYVSSTIAPGGAGKSSLTLVELVAMTSGRALLGVMPPARLKCWGWNGEDPAEEIDRRIEAICLHYNVDPASIENWLFRDSGRDLELIIAHQTRSGFTIAVPQVEALIDALRTGCFDILTVDPFVSAHRVQENDNMAIDAVAKTFGYIADKANCAVELVHHTRKTGGAEIVAEDSRGGSALGYAVRSGRVINTMTKDEAEMSGVGDKRRHYFRADVDKANVAPPATKATWFQLVNVPLGNGSGGPIDDQDYVGVVTPWQWPDMFAGVTVADLREVQNIVAQGRWRANSQAKQWVGLAVAQVLHLDAADKHHRARILSMLKQWKANGMLVGVAGEDDRRHEVTFIEVGKWAND